MQATLSVDATFRFVVFRSGCTNVAHSSRLKKPLGQYPAQYHKAGLIAADSLVESAVGIPIPMSIHVAAAFRYCGCDAWHAR